MGACGAHGARGWCPWCPCSRCAARGCAAAPAACLLRGAGGCWLSWLWWPWRRCGGHGGCFAVPVVIPWCLRSAWCPRCQRRGCACGGRGAAAWWYPWWWCGADVASPAPSPVRGVVAFAWAVIVVVCVRAHVPVVPVTWSCVPVLLVARPCLAVLPVNPQRMVWSRDWLCWGDGGVYGRVGTWCLWCP